MSTFSEIQTFIDIEQGNLNDCYDGDADNYYYYDCSGSTWRMTEITIHNFLAVIIRNEVENKIKHFLYISENLHQEI